MTAKEQKRALRKELLSQRLALSCKQRAQSSELICRRLAEILPEPPGIVMAYAPARNEVDPMPFVRSLWRRALPVAFPAVEDREIVPRLAAKEEDLVPGPFGILQPRTGAAPVDPQELSVVLVPAIAYDRRGYRLGYGGGYYDRFLPRLGRAAVTAGLVYDALLLAELPAEGHDRPVQWVLTETRRLGPFSPWKEPV